VLLAINAAIGAWYYLRLIGLMYLHAPRVEGRRTADVPAFIAVSLCAAVTVGLFVMPQWIWQAIQRVA
jgi:NADH-quinone oxidoreductase subunit N